MIALIVDPTLSEHRFEKDILYLKENSNECARFGIKYIKYSYPYLTVEFKWKGNIRLCICAHNYNYQLVDFGSIMMINRYIQKKFHMDVDFKVEEVILMVVGCVILNWNIIVVI